jgi:hypothetical protein
MDEYIMQQEIMKQELAMKNASYMTPQAEATSALAELTSPLEELRDLELSLKGKAENSKGQEIQIGEPLCNDEGVAAIIRLIKAQVSRKSFLSNYEESDISPLIMFLGRTLIRDLMLNKERYGIKDNTARHQIVFISCTSAFSALKRGLENGERRFLKGGIIETTVNTQAMQNQQKGMWDQIKSGFK